MGVNWDFLFGISDSQSIPDATSIPNGFVRAPYNWPPKVPEMAGFVSPAAAG
jgi:hypothetical protein